MRLVRTPSPHKNESLLGFILRVSESNGYETPYHILQLANINHDQVTAGFPIDKFVTILGNKAEALKEVSYEKSIPESKAREFKILGHSLGSSVKDAPLRMQDLAICPDCVEEHGYIDAFFDLNIAIACSKHKRRVIQKCHQCGYNLRLFRPGLLTCSCGADLRDSPYESIENDTCEFMEIVHSKLYERDTLTKANTCNFPTEHLAALSLPAFLYMISSLGNKNFGLLNPGHPSVEERVKAGFHVLKNWPTNYHNFLEKIGVLSTENGVKSTGLRNQFSDFYESMFKGRKFSKEISFLRDEFIRFGNAKWGKSTIGFKDAKGLLADEKRFISKAEYARLYRLTHPKIEKMIEDGILVQRELKIGARTMRIIDTEKTQSPSDSKGLLTGRQAAAQLGLPLSVLQHLRETKVFQTRFRRGYESSWHIDDVELFLERGISLASIGELDTNLTTLETAMRFKFKDVKTKADIVSAVFDGRLTPVGRLGSKLDSLLLDKVQLEDFTLKKRSALNGNTYTLEQVSQLTGIYMMAVESAVDAGLLIADTFDGNIRVPVISVELFNQSYIPLSKIAEKLGSLAQHLWRTCRANHIEIISLQYKNGLGKQPILFKRDEQNLIEIYNQKVNEHAPKAKECPSYETIFQNYLFALDTANEYLPCLAGSPNKAAIAEKCGFHRDVFYKNEAVKNLLESFIVRHQNQTSTRPLTDIEGLNKFLDSLTKKQVQLLLTSSGRINKQGIAKAAGISRKVFDRHPDAMRLVNEFIESTTQVKP